MVYSCEARGDDRVLCLDSVSNSRGASLVTIYRKSVYGFGIQPVSDWSADGNWIYYASAEDGDWDIYRVHPDGTGRTNLTKDWDSDEIMPAARR
ncbi:hypothetical protein D6833_08045 [Candidatus Parcubacteria bacterium]|nr:MAG: hypothetical protein D6833_08045 [Candidatus Parcubacteria bacterium]